MVFKIHKPFPWIQCDAIKGAEMFVLRKKVFYGCK